MRLLVLLAILLGHRPADACQTQAPCPPPVAFATLTEAQSKLASSDPAIAAKAAYTLAKAGDAKSLAAVGALLLRPAAIKAILKAPDGMRCLMPALLRALADSTEGRKVFVSLLTSTKVWGENDINGSDYDKPQALLHASGVFKPPPAELLAYWKAHVDPHGGWINVTVMALAENGSPDAIALWESLVKGPEPDVPNKAWWFQTQLVGRREQLPYLEMAARLYDAKLPAPVIAALGEALFDYRQIWYGTCPGPVAVPRKSYSADAKKLLRALAVKARAAKPDAALAKAITAALAEL